MWIAFTLGFLAGFAVCFGFAALMAKAATDIVGDIIERLWGK